MDHVQFKYHQDCCPNRLLQPVHLEAIALENHLGTGRMRYPFENRLHLSRVQACLRHEHVERNGKKPERGNIKLTGLIDMRKLRGD